MRRLCNSGLIPHVKRARNGYRILTPGQVELAKILISMKQSGFASREIRQYSRLYRQGDTTIAERTALLTTRKRQLWQEITDRQKAIDFIERQEEITSQQNTQTDSKL